MKPINKIVHKLTKKYVKHQRLSVAELKLHWHHIFDAPLAFKIEPIKLAGFYDKTSHSTAGKTYILHLKVDPSWAIEVQHLQTEICQKMNSYFGCSIIKQLRIQQGQMDNQKNMAVKQKKKLEKLSQNDEIKIENILQDIDNPELNEKLKKLGKTLHASN